jgi:hypothetical protein
MQYGECARVRLIYRDKSPSNTIRKRNSAKPNARPHAIDHSAGRSTTHHSPALHCRWRERVTLRANVFPIPFKEFIMNTKRILSSFALVAAIVTAGCAVAQVPGVDIGSRHGNLRNAQELIGQAYKLIGTAQADNQDQLGGHAQRAKDLLMEADAELRLAANVSNREGR